MSDIPRESSKTLRRHDVFISYKHGKDFDLAKSFSEYLRARGIQTYMDVDYEPIKDPEGLAMGLSAGLALSPILLAFISREYLVSKWCLEELRQFIYARGVILSDEEVKNRDLLSPKGQAIALLSKQPHPMPIIFVVKDEGIGLEEIAYALSQKDLNETLGDTNRRITVIRGMPEDPRAFEDALEYMRVRGIDAAHYISYLPLLSIHTMSTGAIVEKLVGLIKESLQRFNEFEKADPTLQNIHTIWTNLWDRYGNVSGLRGIDPDRVIDVMTRLLIHDPDAQGDMEANSSNIIIDLLHAISAGISRVSYFDRRAARSRSSRRLADYSMYLPVVPDTLKEFLKSLREKRAFMTQNNLRPAIASGTPLDVLYTEAIESDIIRPLQNSYYLFNVRHGRNSRVDITVVACLAINICLGFETISGWDLLEEVLLTPLLRHEDIRNLFPGPFQSESMLRENLEVEETYDLLKKRSEDKQRRMELIRRVKELEGKKQK